MLMTLPHVLLPCCWQSWQTMLYQVGLSYQGSLRKIKSFYSCQFLIFTIFPLFQAVRPCSPPAPLSQTLACPVPVPKELWSLMRSGRRVRQSMASCQSSSTRERTSHLMKFYNHFSGEVVSHIFVFYVTFASLLWNSMTPLFCLPIQNAAAQRDVLFGLALEQTWKRW